MTISPELHEACDGLYVDLEEHPIIVKVKASHVDNPVTWRLRGVLEKLLENPDVELVSTDPILLKWRGNYLKTEESG